jgi:hypothetical protein
VAGLPRVFTKTSKSQRHFAFLEQLKEMGFRHCGKTSSSPGPLRFAPVSLP